MTDRGIKLRRNASCRAALPRVPGGALSQVMTMMMAGACQSVVIQPPATTGFVHSPGLVRFSPA